MRTAPESRAAGEGFVLVGDGQLVYVVASPETVKGVQLVRALMPSVRISDQGQLLAASLPSSIGSESSPNYLESVKRFSRFLSRSDVKGYESETEQSYEPPLSSSYDALLRLSAASEARPPGFSGATQPSTGREDNSQMSENVSRSELDAKLDALRQEMRADSAALRGDFATMSASINQSVATMAVSVADLKGNLQGGLGEIRGSVDGLKSSVTMLQWVIGLVAALAGIWVAYVQLKQSEVAPPTQPAPIVIQVPAYSAPPVPVPVPAPSPTPSKQ